MELHITISPDGRLHCYIPEQDYDYVIKNWNEFLNATGTKYLNDFTLFIRVRKEIRY